MKSYVCGFIFCPTASDNRGAKPSDFGPNPRLRSTQVLLMVKQRPAMQAGFLNGTGGSIEGDETPLMAMNRECFEEVGLLGLDWEHDTVLRGDDWVVYFFSTFVSQAKFAAAYQKTDEALIRLTVQDALFHHPVMPNLHVLITLALDRSGIIKPVTMFDGVPQVDERPANAGIQISQDAFG